MSGTLSFDDLKTRVDTGEVDTVLVCLVDMQGRLAGKRFHARHFIDEAWEETHCCDYLLATDMEMHTVDGYAATSWRSGYGDYMMKPDLSTLRLAPWLPGTALVLCDVLDHHGHHAIAHCPRAVLKRQIARAEAMGLTPMMATELEFFLFRGTVDEIRADGFRNLEPVGGYIEDYHILQTTKEEAVMRDLRNHLYAAGVPVENSKGEAETGQEELNIRYADALACADHHTLAKHAAKEIAWSKGWAASFLAKWRHDKVGSATHIHQSMRNAEGANAFFDPDRQYGMSALFESYLAGLLAYAPDVTYFLAPYINSYKRFQKGSFAPTKTVWSVDNRTAGFRLCAEGSKAVRIECRIGGADLNPYLAQAAGLAGVEEKLTLPPPVSGDIYEARRAQDIPATLTAAAEKLRRSKMLRMAMGDDVVDHYHRAATWEVEAFEAVVTDWEIARGFERA